MKKSFKLIISMGICLSVLTCGYLTSFTSAVTQSNGCMSTTLVDTYSTMTVSSSITVEDMRDEMTYFWYDALSNLYSHAHDYRTARRCRGLTYTQNSPNWWTTYYYATYVGYIEGGVVGSWSLDNP